MNNGNMRSFKIGYFSWKQIENPRIWVLCMQLASKIKFEKNFFQKYVNALSSIGNVEGLLKESSHYTN